MSSQLTIGVRDYCFSMTRRCAITNDSINVSFSFNINGDFSHAATTDDLRYAVDYDRLCHYLQTLIDRYSCQQQRELAQALAPAIFGFSPLITSGYIKISGDCHDTFIIEQCLI